MADKRLKHLVDMNIRLTNNLYAMQYLTFNECMLKLNISNASLASYQKIGNECTMISNR